MNWSVLRQVVNFLVRIGTWVRSTPHTIWIVVGPFIAVIAVGFLPSILDCAERDIRTLGMILQLSGFAVLAIQYDRETHASSGNSWRTWWESRPRIKSRNVVLAAAAGHCNANAFAEGHARTLPAPDASVDRQIELIWQDLNSLHQRVSDEAKKMRELLARNDQEAAAKLTKLSHDVSEIIQTQKASTLASVRFSALGAALFSSGILLASWSPELASFWGSLPSCEMALFN